MKRFPRSSGVLAHITSLPSQFGVGDLGPNAFTFVDFLADSGQTIWQVLPLNPPARGNSPYSCFSVFASNLILISPLKLCEAGWLSDVPASMECAGTVEFVNASVLKKRVLEQAFEESHTRLETDEEFAAFCSANAWWLDEFARFESMMSQFETSDWTIWPDEFRQRNSTALQTWDAQQAREILFSKFGQFVFEQQWNQLKQYSNERNIRLYGDLSIFVAHESADVWANQELFHLGEDGQPTLVAGVPPDYFSETGQRWGNPLYRWNVMEDRGFEWWTNRFRRAQQQFDLLRVDHFRGFESYWEIPASCETALGGKWQDGPGVKPFFAARASLGELPIIAEDLGLITQAVHDLRDELDFPPMRVLQFGFSDEQDDFHRPNTYPEHCVAYTGTHDNDTVYGWYLEQQKNKDPMINGWIDEDQDVHWQLIKMVLESRADTVIIPLQDLLGLDNGARMNLPGTVKGNWAWRVEKSALTNELSKRLREMTQKTGR